MNVINKDILTVDRGIICHQVNCQGVMGTGMALAIKNKWPHVFDKYKKLCHSLDRNIGRDTCEGLGMIQPVEITKELYVFNLFGQNRYGRDKRYTSYGAWETALPKFKMIIEQNKLNLPVYFPYNVGCMNAGGDFRIISAMIEEYFPEATFCKLD